MARYFLTLSYNGANFNGWQIQNNTPNTVQQILEEKLSMLLKEKIEFVGCGRTDTGVNAKNYVAHFECTCKDLIENKEHWIYKFNTVLPPQISVQNIQNVTLGAHARFDAYSRTYYYYIHQQKNPFIDNFSLYVYGDIDFELMNKAASILLEYSDFTSFSKLHTHAKTNTCQITKAIWQKTNIGQWRFTITANRFLRGMVRAVVGTLLLVGKGKISIDDFRKIIEAKDRNVAGSNAAPTPLFLVGINYPKEIFIE
ncbi:MAG: tRNA pseudouridine(38-40) synthase TruA [Bacteroidota bacterium]|nr:tRNA pseudouridine(38-40) synthase TruA [Bacteroidota bacterium]MDP3144515.1 tRNA pseudouridine(38-40) synthase TruA [Bacteroidota bacterium]MDP3555804.1 tRNA pseudouridine(38-40) synthase TruA [Bacteroidota bacterium]